MKEYQENEIQEIADALAEGKILAFPTDTVYGVGTVYGNRESLARLMRIKRRPQTKPVPMMCADLKVLEPIVSLNAAARCLADTFWPGALTLVVDLKPETDRFYTNGRPSAAVRIPDSPVLLKIMKKLPVPLMVTSANLSGEPAALSMEEAAAMLPGLDGILDGSCLQNQASTIVDCTKKDPEILREGPISQKQIEQALKNMVLSKEDRNSN